MDPLLNFVSKVIDSGAQILSCFLARSRRKQGSQKHANAASCAQENDFVVNVDVHAIRSSALG
jgi:hypothetical protein